EQASALGLVLDGAPALSGIRLGAVGVLAPRLLRGARPAGEEVSHASPEREEPVANRMTRGASRFLDYAADLLPRVSGRDGQGRNQRRHDGCSGHDAFPSVTPGLQTPAPLRSCEASGGRGGCAPPCAARV